MLTDIILDKIHPDDTLNAILQKPFFQRLKNIKQLGFVFLDWGRSTHTRYDHSLGSAEVAYRIAKQIGLDNKVCDTLCYSAALHEIGMSPFSYSITEDICDDISYNKVKKCEEIISESFSDILGDRVTDVLDIVTRKNRNNLFDQIIFGILGANTLDYLTRDSYYTMPFFNKDLLETILSLMIIDEDGIVVKKGFKDIYLMIHGAKKIMNHNVYFAPKRRIADMMLSTAIRYSIDNGMSEPIQRAFGDNELFLDLDDKNLLVLLKENLKDTPYEEYITMLSNGKLLNSIDITSFILSNFDQYLEHPDLLRIINDLVIDLFNIESPNFIVDSPLNYIVRFHGEAYQGESSFNYSLPPELLSFTDLYTEPLINRKKKKSLRTQSKWMLYYHPSIEEIINKQF